MYRSRFLLNASSLKALDEIYTIYISPHRSQNIGKRVVYIFAKVAFLAANVWSNVSVFGVEFDDFFVGLLQSVYEMFFSKCQII